MCIRDRYITEIIEKYQVILGLTVHHIKIEKDEKEQYLAMRFRYPYKDNAILYSSQALKDFKTGTVGEREILHELIHILTDPLYAKATSRFASKYEIEDEREALTDKIANIVYKLKK